jgi:xanthosine utilization system XapX-like protein
MTALREFLIDLGMGLCVSAVIYGIAFVVIMTPPDLAMLIGLCLAGVLVIAGHVADRRESARK